MLYLISGVLYTLRDHTLDVLIYYFAVAFGLFATIVAVDQWAWDLAGRNPISTSLLGAMFTMGFVLNILGSGIERAQSRHSCQT